MNKIFFYRSIGPISTKLGTKYPWVKETLGFFQMKNHALVQGGIITKWRKYIEEILKSSPEPLGANFNQN